MDNPKSSFRGSVSYIGLARGREDTTLVVIAGRELFFASSDPGLKGLRITTRNKQIFMVVEEIVAGQKHRICALFHHNVDVGTVLYIQRHINERTLTQEMLADELPDYLKE